MRLIIILLYFPIILYSSSLGLSDSISLKSGSTLKCNLKYLSEKYVKFQDQNRDRSAATFAISSIYLNGTGTIFKSNKFLYDIDSLNLIIDNKNPILKKKRIESAKTESRKYLVSPNISTAIFNYPKGLSEIWKPDIGFGISGIYKFTNRFYFSLDFNFYQFALSKEIDPIIKSIISKKSVSTTSFSVNSKIKLAVGPKNPIFPYLKFGGGTFGMSNSIEFVRSNGIMFIFEDLSLALQGAFGVDFPINNTYGLVFEFKYSKIFIKDIDLSYFAFGIGFSPNM